MGTAGAEQLRQRLAQGLAARPVLREALRALGAGGFSFVLAGAGLLSAHVPLALAPVCVLPFGPAAVCAYLGAVAGYAVFWGLSAALEPVAAGFLMLAGSCLFRDLLPAQRRGFVPAAAGGIYALLGLIFVLQADGGIRAALLLALRLTLLVVSIRRSARRRRLPGCGHTQRRCVCLRDLCAWSCRSAFRCPWSAQRRCACWWRTRRTRF